jgi:hypothetical protein
VDKMGGKESLSKPMTPEDFQVRLKQERRKYFLGLLIAVGNPKTKSSLKRELFEELLSEAIPKYKRYLQENIPYQKREIKEKDVVSLEKYFGFSEEGALFYTSRLASLGFFRLLIKNS